ncbi:helix-turn-helix domain-containing protein [Streptomyces sp. NPDC059569]|uniref:helix-turn-helix domain-containing protein n=1 Tax=unclassified Streptomyces TaxID=2593676 RepID=UPI00367E71D5
MQDRNPEIANLWKKGKPLKGIEREKVAKILKGWYLEEGLSIRAIRDETGRSFGFVHRMLSEAGVDFRSRGGDFRSTRRVKSKAKN